MKFPLRLNDDDYVAFNICHFLSNPDNKPTVWKGLLKMAPWSVLLVFLAFLFLDREETFWLIFLGVLLLLDVVLVFYEVLSWPRRVRKTLKKSIESLKKQGKLPYEAESVVEFLDEEFQESFASGVQRRKYSEISRVLRDEEHIYVLVGALRALILPLRCLEGREEELLAFLRGKMRQDEPQTGAQ